MKISVIGSGYVGLVTGTCLAEMGNEVLCLDTDSSKVAHLQKGHLTIFEPGLHELVSRNLESGRLRFTDDAKLSAEFGDIHFIAVGTPSGEDGSADLSYVLQAAQNIGLHVIKSVIVVNKSTVPVGTVDKVRSVIETQLKSRSISLKVHVASNPEFLREGSAIADFCKPDRIIVGSEDQLAIHSLSKLYAPLLDHGNRLLVMDSRSAELTKYAANAMLATRISFMNEMANLADSVGADIEAVRQGIGSDPRIGNSFLLPGPGYGGSCFPKDVKALVQIGQDYDQSMLVVSAVEEVNKRQRSVIIEKIMRRLNGKLEDKRLAVWGLSFKPNTDDMREAPSIPIILSLIKAGAHVCAYDPAATDQAKEVLGEIPRLTYHESAEQACLGADALVIITDWDEFRSPNFARLETLLRTRLIFDCRNLYDPQVMLRHGFEYYTIGRGPTCVRNLPVHSDEEASDPSASKPTNHE